jgi:hypothetical protein
MLAGGVAVPVGEQEKDRAPALISHGAKDLDRWAAHEEPRLDATFGRQRAA